MNDRDNIPPVRGRERGQPLAIIERQWVILMSASIDDPARVPEMIEVASNESPVHFVGRDQMNSAARVAERTRGSIGMSCWSQRSPRQS
jgi:hypothetical protein